MLEQLKKEKGALLVKFKLEDPTSFLRLFSLN